MQRLLDSVRRILVPLSSVMVAREMRYGPAAQRLKEAFVEACERDFALDERRLTLSRISLLTGLHRPDTKAIRERLAETTEQHSSVPESAVARVVAYWQETKPYCGPNRVPRVLPRTAPPERLSFERLVGEISRDIHPRTVLDELERQALVAIDEKDRITLRVDAALPDEEAETQLHAWGANLGDHAEAAAANLSYDPDAPPHFEQAVYQGGLSEVSIKELNRFAAVRLSEALDDIETKAKSLRKRDRNKSAAYHRFRAGGFTFHANEHELPDDLP